MFSLQTLPIRTRFATLIPPPKGGRLLSGHALDDPIPCLLQGSLVQGFVSQLLLEPFKQEELCWSQVRRIGWMLKPLDAVGGKPTLNDSGRMHWCIVPMERPLLFNHSKPLFLDLLEKVAQGLDNVFAVDRRTLGVNVAVDDAFAVKKKANSICIVLLA